VKKNLTGNRGLREFFWPAAAGVAVAFPVAWFNAGPHPVRAFFISFLFAGFAWWVISKAMQWLGANRSVKWATVLTFGLRLLIGIILFAALPIYGYDEEPPNNGYLYLDAYRRDSDAWTLASSGQSLANAFSKEFATDQYGGLLSLSAGIYRLLSPDAHRPLLVLILTSFFAAVGLPFFWKGVNDRWGGKTANAGVWIYAFYPESIILGASQMREPILIGLSAVAFWAVLKWREDRRLSIIYLILSVLLMAFISIKAAAAIVFVLSIWFWMENLLPNMKKSWRLISFAIFTLVIIAGIFFGWGWLVDSSQWDLLLMEGSSGRIQWEVELIGERFRTPFIIGYGLAQPVLPAAIIYPGLPITRSIAIFRALGWYLLVPLLISGFILLWKKQPKSEQRILLVFFLAVLFWTVISSARAGGDQWDNPRYRAILLVWMALLGGWSWAETIKQRSPWLWRLLFLEMVYIGFFIHWYLSRYYGLFKRMDFWPMVSLLGGIGITVIFGGLIFDLIYNKVRKGQLK
jgi:hypothetical protein